MPSAAGASLWSGSSPAVDDAGAPLQPGPVRNAAAAAVGAATWTGTAPQLPLCLVATDDAGLLRGPDDPLLIERSAAGAPLLLASEDNVELSQGDFALVPVALPDRVGDFPDG